MIENLDDLIVERAPMDCEQYISLLCNSKGHNSFGKMFGKMLESQIYCMLLLKEAGNFFRDCSLKKIIEKSQLNQ